MISTLLNIWRLVRASLVLAHHGIRFIPKGVKVPLILHIAHVLTWPLQVLFISFRVSHSRETKVSRALSKLGPSYVKLGQFIATRADLIDHELANDLRNLQDRQPPFSMREAISAVEDSLGGKLKDHFLYFGPPIAAASIAQVHKAVVVQDGIERNVAVKILRPGIEHHIQRDIDSYFFAAHMIERFYPLSRRLKPVAIVNNLKKTTEFEMDLRLEGAAISEMTDNINSNPSFDTKSFRVPKVDWKRTSKRILTLEWIEGTPISQIEKLREDGHDLRALGHAVLSSFLHHVMHDGFFHADMHQGNLLVEPNGTIVAVDFGIIGHLSKIERRFLAEILHGLITRDYALAAQVHFDAGYVPANHPVALFAQAMRAIGEPIHGRTANEISMANLLGQLFAYTDVFDMETRPELILLQKSMVIVEGVARSLDPKINIWTAAQPVAENWMQQNYGIYGRMRETSESAGEIGKIISKAPRILEHIDRSVYAFTKMAKNGIYLDDYTINRMVKESSKYQKNERWPLRLISISITIALWLILAEQI